MKIYQEKEFEMNITEKLETLRKDLPPIIARHDIERLLGGLITKGYLQNLDSEGLGPEKIRIGRKIAYMRDDLIAFLQRRASNK